MTFPEASDPSDFQTKYNILYFSKEEDGFDLIKKALLTHGSQFEIKTARTEEEFLSHLQENKPDLILAGTDVSAKTTLRVLQAIKLHLVRLPLILIVNAVTHEVAQLLHAGAEDYVLATRLKRLPYTVINTLEKYRYESEGGVLIDVFKTKQEVVNNNLADDLRKEGEAKYRSMIESSLDAILLTLKTGEILAANKAACTYFQMSEVELINSLRSDIVDVTNPNLKLLLEERDLTGRAQGELTFIRRDESKFQGEVSSVVFTDASGVERCSVTIRDITHRKLTEEKIQTTSDELKEALNGLNKIMNSSLDVICAVDADGYFLKVSAASEAVWGYKPEEMVGQPLIDFVYKEDNDSTQATANQVMKGRKVNHFENRYVRKDGTVVPIEWTARWDEHDKVRYGVARDVTEKKRLQKAFEDERVRFQDIFLQAPCIMATLKGHDYIFESANIFCQQFLGKTDILGKPLCEVMPDAIKQGFIGILDSVYKTGKTYSALETKVSVGNTASGNVTENYVDVIVQVLKNLQGDTEGVFVFALDVTQQVIAREKNAESERKYRQIVEMAQEGIWVMDENNRTTFVNDKMCRIFGYTSQELIGKDAIFLMDKSSHEFTSENLQSRSVTGPAQYYQRYISKSGEEIWAYVSITPLHREDGVYSGALAMLTDMTEIKRAEELIKRSEERYRTLFEQNLAGFYQSSLDGTIINCNNAFAQMLRYDSAKELLEVKAADLYFTPKERSDFIKDVVLNQSLHNYEGVLKTKDGQALYYLENVSVQVNPDNGVEYFDGIIIDITQKKEAELKLKESNERFIEAFNEKNTILESIGDAFFAVDKNWVVTYWNSQAEKILQTSKADIVGKRLWEIFSSSINSFSYQKYHEALETGKVILFEDYYKSLNKWYEVSAYPSTHGLSVYIKDITDRKRTEEAVRASEQVRRLIMDSAMDAIICIDVEGYVTVWNPQAEKIFGWQEKEVLGKLISDIVIPSHLREGFLRGLVKYLTTGYGPLLRKPFESVALHASGFEFPVELSVVSFQQGETEFFCAFIRDISARKIAEANLSKLHDNLLEQSKKLQISNEELEKYAYVTSHDLQEPLRMVTSFLQLLKQKYEGQLDDTAQKYINFAVDGAGRMKMLILDLLEFSRISSVQEPHKNISLKEVVSKTLLSLKSAIDETQAIIYVPDLPEIPGNEFQLMQLFQNLLSNAIKYRGDESPVIEIGVSEAESHWHFFVKDNGIGIDPKFFDKIFVIFQRLHNKKNFAGTGIGLAICKKIVELHEGRIWVESNGNGTTFHFMLQKTLRENIQ